MSFFPGKVAGAGNSVIRVPYVPSKAYHFTNGEDDNPVANFVPSEVIAQQVFPDRE